MQGARKQITSEGFSALRVCSDLRDFIDSGRTRRTYLLETEEFLDYIVDSVDAVASSVRHDIETDIPDELLEAKLRDLGEIKRALVWVYTFAKQAIEADSLSIPFSLATYINYIAQEIQRPSTAKIVVVGSPNLMYYKWNLGNLRDLSTRLASKVNGYPVLGGEIGLLMFPYCGAKEVLVNCDLFHEMGHYIYETTDLESKINTQIANSLARFIEDSGLMNGLEAPLFVANRLYNYVRGLLLTWADEIFADILAIRVLGPAFHLAYLELQQVLRVSTATDPSGGSEVGAENAFSETHPADNFRFKLHAKWLKQCGWCEVIQQYAFEVFAYLEAYEKLKMEAFTINCPVPIHQIAEREGDIHKWMLNQVEKLVETVEACVSKKLENVPNPHDDYKHTAEHVMSCLEHGVVPSTGRNPEGLKIHPRPTTLLNAGFFFFLGGMERLLQRVKSKANPIEKRLHYEKRLNEWLAKAIDDWQILRMEHKL